MSSKHKFSDEPIVQPQIGEQLRLDQLHNVTPIEAGRVLAGVVLAHEMIPEAPDTDPHGSLGGGVRPRSEYGHITAMREPMVSEMKAKKARFDEYAGRAVMASPEGKAISYGFNVIRMLGEREAGNPHTEIRDFLESFKRPKNDPLTDREKAERVLRVEGLEIIKQALNGNVQEESKRALDAIGGSVANLHIDIRANSLFGSLIESTHQVLRTFGVFRREGKMNILVDDPVAIISDIQTGIARSAGYKIPTIDRQKFKPWEYEDAKKDLAKRRKSNRRTAATVLGGGFHPSAA